MSKNFKSSLVYVYKILNESEAKLFSNDKIFFGNSSDIKSGYIHLCKNFAQITTIINSKYNGEICYIYKFDSTQMTKLKFEYVKKLDDYYPQLYEPLLLSNLSDSIKFSNKKNLNNLENIQKLSKLFKKNI